MDFFGKISYSESTKLREKNNPKAKLAAAAQEDEKKLERISRL